MKKIILTFFLIVSFQLFAQQNDKFFITAGVSVNYLQSNYYKSKTIPGLGEFVVFTIRSYPRVTNAINFELSVRQFNWSNELHSANMIYQLNNHSFAIGLDSYYLFFRNKKIQPKIGFGLNRFFNRKYEYNIYENSNLIYTDESHYYNYTKYYASFIFGIEAKLYKKIYLDITYMPMVNFASNVFQDVNIGLKYSFDF